MREPVVMGANKALNSQVEELQGQVCEESHAGVSVSISDKHDFGPIFDCNTPHSQGAFILGFIFTS